jgi:IclR family mhp operon transcriptional activator
MYLATLSGSKLIIRETSDHGNALAVERYCAGFQMPLLTTAAGRVYLAFCPAAQRDALIDIFARSNKEEDKAARIRPELMRALEELRKEGYATATRTRRLIDEITLSVPLPLGDRSLAVLSVRFIASAMPIKLGLERFLPKLRQCAAKISSSFLEQQPGAAHRGAPHAAV